MFWGKIWSELLSLSMRDLFVLLARNSNLDNEHFKMVKYFKQDKKKERFAISRSDFYYNTNGYFASTNSIIAISLKFQK